MSKPKKKQQRNYYDVFIEDLSLRFSQIPNFHLNQEDEFGKKQFNFITRRFTEVHSIKTLFLNYYIPASSKAVAYDLAELKLSKYKNLVSLSNEDLKENYYETIRLGYVALFHKFESFINECILMAEELTYHAEINSSISLIKFTEKEFDFKIKNWKTFPTIENINWVCNCVKHYDSLPHKLPKPRIYQYLPSDSKIKLTKEDFKRDAEGLDQIYLAYLQMIYTLAIYKIHKENYSEDNFSDIIQKNLYIENSKKYTEQIKVMIETLKS